MYSNPEGPVPCAKVKMWELCPGDYGQQRGNVLAWVMNQDRDQCMNWQADGVN